MSKPLLSIGIIFKNEIRCLERCLKSLQPLRDTLSCELVMADTGSDDGSREVAERYADILFDFPWIDDFSAARNAVLDRCSGKWFFFIDSDEWLDSDVSELADFLRGGKNRAKSGVVVQRNYNTYDVYEGYRDFYTTRLARLTGGLRFEGTIHEHFSAANLRPAAFLGNVILNHDGYVGLRHNKEKLARNVSLLREKLEANPQDLKACLQLIESGSQEEDYVYQIQRAVAAVEQRVDGWKHFGPPILRYAVVAAHNKGLPELEKWAAMAEEWFPDSFFTRIDVEYFLFSRAWEEKKYEECIRRGERYRQAMEDNRAGLGDQGARRISTIIMEDPQQERQLSIFLADAYLYTGQEGRTVELLEQINGGELNAKYTGYFVQTLQELHTRTTYDTTPLVSAFWEQISEPKPTKKWMEDRKKAVYRTAFRVFMPKAQNEEAQKEYFCRHAYTLYLPLRDKCELGRAAAILETENGAEMAGLLSQVERWDVLPVQALSRALHHGVAFPLPDKPMHIEEIDALAGRLAADKKDLFQLVGGVLTEDFAANAQSLLWARGLGMAAVQAFDWRAKDADANTGLCVTQFFMQTEKAFLPFCYAPEILQEENLPFLPPMHRFGWYCVQAFDALDSGDAISYVRLLRSGLGVCKDVKDMVEFLVEHTPDLQTQLEPSAELLALAEQIRTILANFAPDDPAVATLKQSQAYQSVAYLIEGR